MHNPVRRTQNRSFNCPGVDLDVFLCSSTTVNDWGEPVLRNSFWRCYLPTSEGAEVRSGAATWPLRPGTVLIIPPDCPVSGYASGPFSLHYAHFNCSLRLHGDTPHVISPEAELGSALDRAVERRDDTGFGLAMSQLVVTALQALPADLIRHHKQNRDTVAVYRIMKENLDHRLSNAELAKSLNTSESSLLRSFRSATGTTIQKEHLRLRLERAATLLQQTERSIEQIAAECGFWDRNHFSRVFTREWHVPPARYRRSATAL